MTDTINLLVANSGVKEPVPLLKYHTSSLVTDTHKQGWLWCLCVVMFCKRNVQVG